MPASLLLALLLHSASGCTPTAGGVMMSVDTTPGVEPGTVETSSTGPSVPPSAPPSVPPPVETSTASCGECPPLPVRREDLNSKAISITEGANPCPTLSLSCSGTEQTSATIITFYDLQGQDIGSTFGRGTATAMLQCDADTGLWADPSGNVTNIFLAECISATLR